MHWNCEGNNKDMSCQGWLLAVETKRAVGLIHTLWQAWADKEAPW